MGVVLRIVGIHRTRFVTRARRTGILKFGISIRRIDFALKKENYSLRRANAYQNPSPRDGTSRI